LHSWPTNQANNALPAIYCKPLTAPATNMFIWARLGAFFPYSTTDGAETFRLCFAADVGPGHPDATKWIGVGYGSFSAVRVYNGCVCTVGGTSGAWTQFGGTTPQLVGTPQAYEYVAVHKIGTVYHFWLFNEGGQRLYLGGTTQATFVPAWFGFQWTCGNSGTTLPGTPVLCADFIRRIDTAVFPF
jgi:hypothetical protein